MVLDEHLPRAQLKLDGCDPLRFPGKGEKFMYDYAGETLSTVAGTSERKTGMQLNAKVTVAFASKCSFVLEISEAKLLSKSATESAFKLAAESAKFQKEIMTNDLLFSLGASGEVETVHAHKEEPTHIVNIKRGILSQLQLDQNAQVETDVNGVCDVEVTESNGKIIKTKDLSKCSKRAVNEIGLQSGSVQTESGLKPLASTSKCTYEIAKVAKESPLKFIKSVVCEETHMFRPFSAGFKSPSGALTTVSQKLVFTGPGKATIRVKTSDFTVGSTLTFDHETEITVPANTITGQVETIMGKLVQKSADGSFVATQTSAKEFQNLVAVLRKMDVKRLTPVWNDYIDCIKSKKCEPTETDLRDIYKQYMLDAVTYCGTPTCIAMIRDVIINGQVSGERMNMFLQGIALVGKTELNMIRDVLLIVKKTPSRQAFLTLGTLLHRQCTRNAQDCHYDTKNPVTQAETYLEKILGDSCEKQTNYEDLETILMSLKAIGNAGRPVSAFKKVLACGIKSQHGNLTVAAFDALRRMPCDHKRSEQILSFVSNQEECPEKRSHAFKALVKCPDEQILHKLVHQLEVEPSKQLGSFMWTTLTNIMESSDPKHATCRTMLSKITAGKPLKAINMPMHQFSKNFEKSILLEKLNSGVTAEGDIIFNPDGYLPRSAFFNLTANVMGVPVHIVEASAQVNGMETLLEDVFGPEGMFPDNTVFKMFNFTLTKEKLQEMAQKRNERSDADFVRRTRRSAGNNVDDNLNDLHKRVHNKREMPTGSLSFKVMGQEIRAFSYDDLFWAIDKIDNMNVITMLLDVAKGGRKTFSKSMMFLEMTHAVPTGLGLPLKLKLVGSTVSSIELDGKFDIRNMFWGPSSMMIKGSIKPSASVEITGQMGIFSHFIDTGIYVSNTMHTSQFMKGSIEYKQGQKLKINLDTPDEPIQLFHASSTPFMFMNEQSELIEGTARKINPDVCANSVVLGFGLCTSVRIPVAYRDYEAPYYPLSGPAHFGMKLKKVDAKLTTYQFLAQLQKKGDVTNGVISLSTPGATYERKMEGDMSYAIANNVHTLTVGTNNALGSTGKRAELEVSYDAISHTVKLGSKTDLITPSFINYDFSLFNETSPAGRAFGVRAGISYDKYKYSTETKVVKTKTGAMLMSSATYYPGKTITGTLEFNQISKKVFARLDADQFKQLAVEFAGQYIRRGSYRGVTLTGSHLMSGKKASLSGGLDDGKLIITGDVNGKSAKTVLTVTPKKIGVEVDVVGKKAEIAATLDTKPFTKIVTLSAIVEGKAAKLTATVDYKSDKVIVLAADILGNKASTTMGLYTPGKDVILKATATAAGKTISTAAGYYVKAGKQSWKIEGDALGHHVELYTNYLLVENKILVIGAKLDQYSYGFRSVYSTKKGNSLCSSVFYNLGKREIEPLVACARYQDFQHDHGYMHKVITLSADLKHLKQNFETIINLEKHAGHAVVKTSLLQNGNEKAFSTFDCNWGSVKNAQTKITIGSGKKTASLAAYSKLVGDALNFGLEATVLDKSAAFIVKYIAKPSDWTLKSVIQINGNELPVNTAIRYYRGAVSGTELSCTIKDMSVIYASTFKNSAPAHSMNARLSLTKAGKEVFATYKNSILVWSAKTKSFEQQFGAIVAGKKYQYGYTFQVLDKSSASKSAIATRFILGYSTTRSSSITFTFANGQQTTEFHSDIEYLPGSHLKQVIILNRVLKKLDITFEILPKMTVKYSAKMNKLKGLASLSHDLSLQVDGAKKSAKSTYNKSIKWVNEFVNSKKNLRLATNVGKHLSVSYERKNPKTSVAKLRLLKTKAEFVTTYVPSRNALMFRFIFNNKEQFAATAELNKGKASLDLSRGGKQLQFDGIYIKAQRKLNLNINWNKKAILGLSLQHKIGQNAVSFKVKSALGTTFEVIGRREGAGLFLKFIANKMMIQYGAQLDKKTKTLTLSADTGKRIIGLRLRADYANLIAAARAFCDKKVIGWEAAVKDNALIIEIDYTPSNAVLITFEVQADRIIKVIFSRKSDQKTVHEFTTHLKLTPEMFKLAFNLNKDSIKNLFKTMANVADVAQNKVRKISRRSVEAVKEAAKKVDMKLVQKNSKKAMDFISSIEDLITKELAKTDYKDLINKIRTATKKSLEEAAKLIDQFKGKMPELVKQVKEILNAIKAQLQKVDLTKIKKIAKEQLKELAKYNKDIQKKIDILVDTIKKIVNSLTKSSRPVIAKAIKLVKNFKIRGQTIESLVKLVLKKGEKYIRVYVKLAKDQLKELTKQGEVLIQKGKVLVKQGTDYVMKMKLPYCNLTTKECIELVIKKFNELKKELKSVELTKLAEKIQTAILTYKFNGKTLEQHFVVLKGELKKLPTITREAVKKALKIIKEYLKEVQQYKKYVEKYGKITKKSLEQAVKVLKEMGVEVADFAKPLTDYAVLVSKSVEKNFGPLAKKTYTKIQKLISTIDLDMDLRPIIMKQLKVIEKVLLPLVKPILPLYNNLLTQIRQLQVLGIKIGPMFDAKLKELETILEQYIKTSGSQLTKIVSDIGVLVEKVNKMSPEKIVDFAFDQADKLVIKTVKDLQTAYKQRKVIMQKTLAKSIELYKQLKELVRGLDKKSITTAVDILFKQSGEMLTKTSNELKSLAEQLSKLDLKDPAMKAWKDILGQLKSYGINARIINAINAAKKLNPTKQIQAIVKQLEKMVKEIYDAALVKAVVALNKVQKAANYIKTIPKKTYEEWFKELKQFFKENKSTIINYFQSAYGISKTQAELMFKSLNKLNNVNFEQIYSEYVKPTTEMGKELAEKIRRVRRDIEQPTIALKDLYATKVGKFSKDKADMLYNRLIELYNKLRLIVENNYKSVTKDVIAAYVEVTGKVMDKAEQMYTKFITKYGNMTWEEISDNVYKMGEKQVLVLKKLTEAEIQKLMVLIEKLKVLAKNTIAKVNVEYKQAIAKATVVYKDLSKKTLVLVTDLSKKAQAKYAELKPKVVAALDKIVVDVKKYKVVVVAKLEELKKVVEHYIKQGKEMVQLGKSMALIFYETNKNKSIREIYLDAKKIGSEIAKTQFMMIKASIDAKLAELKIKSAELKVLYKKYMGKIQTVVQAYVPEIKKEIVSISNQLVQGYAELTEEIAIQFYPQYKVVRDELLKIVKIAKAKIAEITALIKPLIGMDLADVKLIVKKNVDKLVVLIKKLVAELKKKVDNMDFTKLKELKTKVDALVKLAKLKFDEIKKNPRIVAYRKLVLKKLQEISNNPTLVKTKMMLEKQLKDMEKFGRKNYLKYSKLALKEYKETIQEYKQQINKIRNSPTFKQALKTLQKLQVSADFTVSQLAKKITPLIKKVIKDLTIFIEAAPAACTKAYQQFQKDPEKTFWNAVDVAVKQSKIAMETAKKVKPSDVRSALINGQEALIKLAAECTDDYAKATAKKVVKSAQKTAKDAKIKFVELKRDATQTIRRIRREAPIMATKYMKQATKEATRVMTGIQKDAKIIYDKSLKPIVENQIWGEIAAEFYSHEITDLVRDLIKLIRKGADIVAKETIKVYNKAVAKATVAYKDLSAKAIAIWNTKFPELKKAFEQVKARVMAVWNTKFPEFLKKFEQLKKLIIAKLNELKATMNKLKTAGLKKFADLKTKYYKLKEELKNLDVEKQIELLKKTATEAVAELKKTATEAVAELKKTALANVAALKKTALANLNNLKKLAIELYGKAYAAAYKFVNETKIVDIENFVKKIIRDIEKLIKDTKAKLVYLRDNYEKIAKKYIDQGVELVKPLIAKYKAEAIKLITKYRALGIKMFNQYKALGIKLFNEYKVKAVAFLKKYEAVTMKALNTVKAKAVELYKKLEAIVLKYKTEAIKMYNAYKPIVEALLKDYKTQAMKIYNTYKPKVLALLKKIEALLNKYKAQAVKLINTYKPLAIAALNQYKEQALQQFNKVKSAVLKLYNIYKPQFVAKYEALVKKLTTEVLKTYNTVKPKVIAAYNKVKALVLLYKAELTKISQTLAKDAKAKALKMYNAYKPKVLALLKKVEAIINKYKGEALAVYNKYKPVVVALLKKYETLALKYKDEACKMIQVYKQKAMDLAWKVVLKIHSICHKLIDFDCAKLRDDIQKLALKAYNISKAKIIALYNELIAPVVKKYKALVMPIVDKCIEEVVSAYNDYKVVAEELVEKVKAEVEKALVTLKDPKKLVELVKTKVAELVKILRAKALEIKAKVEKTIATFDAQKLLKELKAKALELKALLEKMLEKSVKDLVVRFNNCVAKCQKDMDKLTTFLRAKVAEMKSKALEIKSLVEKTLANPEELKKLLLTKALELKAIGEKSLAKLKVEVERLVKLIQAKALEIKSKVEKSIAAFDAEKLIKELTTKALEIQAKLKQTITKLALDIKAKIEQSIETGKAKAQVIIKDLTAQALKIKALAEAKLTQIKAEIERIINELKSTWETSALRKNLITLKKMTIKQTIAAIKELPSKTKKLVIAEFNRIRAIVEAEFNKKYGQAIALYKDICAKVLAIYKERYAQALALYNKISSKAVAAYKEEYAKALAFYKKALVKFEELKTKVTAKLIVLKNEVTTAAMPAILAIRKYTDAITKEVTEAAKFGYKYYDIEGKMEAARTKILAEYRRLDPMIRKMIIEFFEMLKKELESYKKQGKELVEIYKKQGIANFNEYKKFAIKSLKKNFANAKVQSVKLAQQTGHAVLRGIHTGLVAIDNIDTTKLSRQARSVATTLSKIVDLDTKNLKVTINIPHGGSFHPTFTMNMNKLKQQVKTLNIRARRAVKTVEKEMVKQADRVQRVVNEVKRKAMESKLMKDAQKALESAQKTATEIQKKVTDKTIVIYEKLMKETTEIRRDLMMIVKADRQLIKHVIAELKQMSTMYWRKAMNRYQTYKLKAKIAYKKALRSAKAYIAKAKRMSTRAYMNGAKLAKKMYKNPKPYYNQALKIAKKYLAKAEAMAADMYKSSSKVAMTVYNNPTQTYEQAVQLVNKYIQTLRNKIIATYKQNAPIAQMMAKKYYTQLKSELETLQKNTMKMATPIADAILRIKNGESPTKVLRPFINKAGNKYRKFVTMAKFQAIKYERKTRRAVCSYDRIFCRLLATSFNVNKMVFDKYAEKLFNLLMVAKVQSDRSMRQTRVMLSNLGEKSSTLAAPTYQAIGMVFGKSHVITFDQKYYDFIEYNKPDCTYVLARDFTDGKFSILSQQNHIIVKTPDMTVKIGADGKTKTTIGSVETTSLPVKSDSGVCMRYGGFIKCYFMEQKFKVTVDLKHFAAVIGLSGWHHGKSQGLLGTNNHESYDEWRMPSGKVTTDVYELANAYEVTQRRKCIAKRQQIKTPVCNKRPSARCEELFASKNSQYAKLFGKIKAEAFLKACQADSSDCSSNAREEIAHCNAAGAFVMYARAQWQYASMPADCNTFIGKDKVAHNVGTTWTQKPLKRSIDVVVLVSERTAVAPAKGIFVKTLANIYKRMIKTGFNARFALVGFGGHDVHEKAHVHPLEGEIFGKMGALAEELRAMPYSGKGQDTNDAYHAILKASNMNFRPGASRVFIMYNTVPHVSHEHGPTYDEAMHALVNEANATLFVFDKLVFKKLNKHTIIGQSNGKMYTDDNRDLPLPNVELPASEFKSMVKATHGGLFSNKIRSKKIGRVAASMYNGISYWLNKDSQLCKKCTLSKTWYGNPVPICVAQSKC
jgi:hypothetical protein